MVLVMVLVVVFGWDHRRGGRARGHGVHLGGVYLGMWMMMDMWMRMRMVMGHRSTLRSGPALELGRMGRARAIAGLDHVRLERDGPSSAMKLQKQATGVAQHLARLVTTPQRRRRRLAVLADGRRRRARRRFAVLTTSGGGRRRDRGRGRGRGLGYFHCTIIEAAIRTNHRNQRQRYEGEGKRTAQVQMEK